MKLTRVSAGIAALTAAFVSSAAAGSESWLNGERVPTRAAPPSVAAPNPARTGLNDGPPAEVPAPPTIPGLEVDAPGLVNGGSVATGTAEPRVGAGKASAPRHLNGGTVAPSDAAPNSGDPAGRHPNTLD